MATLFMCENNVQIYMINQINHRVALYTKLKESITIHRSRKCCLISRRAHTFFGVVLRGVPKISLSTDYAVALGFKGPWKGLEVMITDPVPVTANKSD